MLEKRIALIGGGNIAEALVAGMLAASVARPEQLFLTDILTERRTLLQSRYKIRVGSDNKKAGKLAQIVILALKPQALEDVLNAMRPALTPGTLVISVAAGYSISRLATRLSSEIRIARAMPNIPSSVREGITALSFGPGMSEEEARIVQTIFESVGKVVMVEESLMDAVTGLSGSGPAYVYLMIEALADGGVKMGLSRPVAELLAAQTVLGAARMVLESGDHPGRLKDRVASPGGTTIAGLHKLEVGRLRATLISAVEAATKRSKELGEE